MLHNRQITSLFIIDIDAIGLHMAYGKIAKVWGHFDLSKRMLWSDPAQDKQRILHTRTDMEYLSRKWDCTA